MTTKQHHDPADDFYVGYRPAPTRHRRFAGIIFLTCLVGAALAGASLAWLMDDPGDAVWQSEPTTIAGTLRLDPVPFIETELGPVLLVEIGKFGSRDLSALGDGRSVRAQGLLLGRGSQRMLELAAGDSAIAPGDDAAVRTASRPTARSVTIAGEIIDTKCFLGAMKPGQGRAHAACARLCIRGGIPAGIVGTADGGPVWAVIDPGDAGVVSEELLNAVGSPVVITGELVTLGGLDVLRGARLVGGD